MLGHRNKNGVKKRFLCVNEERGKAVALCTRRNADQESGEKLAPVMTSSEYERDVGETRWTSAVLRRLRQIVYIRTATITHKWNVWVCVFCGNNLRLICYGHIRSYSQAELYFLAYLCARRYASQTTFAFCNPNSLFTYFLFDKFYVLKNYWCLIK